MPVAIINSGGANIASLKYALDRLGADSELTANAQQIRSASHVILPGVGAAANAMDTLRKLDLDRLIPDLTQPVLGVCLGMQLMCASSDEDEATCLGILPVNVSRLPAAPQHPVPNMGWSPVTISAEHPLLEGIGSGDYFYFLHSFAIQPGSYTVATATHQDEFTAVLAHRNFCATQFHPERSSDAGSRLLRNFLQM